MESNHHYRGYQDLIVYQRAYQLALSIFKVTKTFPREEQYSLVDQIRRSARSVAVNLSESWYKRTYPKAFVSKLVDVAGEAGETQVWLDFSHEHGYLGKEEHEQLTRERIEISKMLSSMINHPEKFCH
jgi:four helix bundle protein